MSASLNRAAGPDRAADDAKQDNRSPTTPVAGEPHPADRVEQWAVLLTDGEVEWPQDLPADLAAELTIAVRHRRRSGLMRLIAKAIVADLADDR